MAVRMGVSVGLGTPSPYPKELLQCCSLPGALPVPWMCFHTSNPAGILGPPLFFQGNMTGKQADKQIVQVLFSIFFLLE